MTINAYLLAADPTWLRESVFAYYGHVDRIVVSYDREARGWTGVDVSADECLAVLHELDADRKVELLPGDYVAREGETYLEAETRQRRHALAHAARGADWVLQIDTDEVLPDWQALRETLDVAASLDLASVEWPMRLLYRRLHGGAYLEVATAENTAHFEYPGPIAVRPGVDLVDCRRAAGEFLRPVVRGDSYSLQLRNAPTPGEHRRELLSPTAAIWHNSWARPRASVRRKVASWGHNEGMRSRLYYYGAWLPAPVTWRLLRRIHPFHRPLWPRLRISSDLPEGLRDARP